MKLRVVNWVSYDDDYPEGDGGWAARNAIIDDIRAHGYVFSGWAHQEGDYCVPLLNDGKMYTYSQRGWGDVMAEAHGYMGPMDYAKFAFSLDSSAEIRPRHDYSLPKQKPEQDLNEEFELEVSPPAFKSASESGELRLDSYENLRYIYKGDALTLTCQGESSKFLVRDAVRERDGKKLVLHITLSLVA